MKTRLYVLLSYIVTVFSLGSTFGEQVSNDYVGSDTCITCHQGIHSEIVNGWKTSTHHLTMQAVSENKDLPGNFTLNTSLQKKDVLAIIGHEGGHYVFIGTNFQVIPPESFKIDEFELTEAPHDGIGIKGENIDASQRCFGCHATGYFVSQKKFSEPGVGCEACHGPGKKHVDAKGSEGSILNPAKLSPDLNRMVCGQCHSLGKDPSGKHPFPVMSGGNPFQPGQNLTEGFVDAKPLVDGKIREYSHLVYRAADFFSKQTCTDCHEPHGRLKNPSMLTDATNGTCNRCHVGEIAHYLDDKTPCWECHMDYDHSH